VCTRVGQSLTGRAAAKGLQARAAAAARQLPPIGGRNDWERKGQAVGKKGTGVV